VAGLLKSNQEMQRDVLNGMTLRGLVLGVIAPALFFGCSGPDAGPRLSARATDGSVHIEARLLGEYELGLDRLRIQAVSTSRTICDLAGHWGSDIDLQVGVNTVATMFREDAATLASDPARECRLDRGNRYRVTLWGNNGWGVVRPASVDVAI